MIVESLDEQGAAREARRFDARRVSAAVLAAALLFVYWPTFRALAARWTEQGAYDHGWLVLAGLVWLVARRPLSVEEHRAPALWTLLLLMALSAVWSAALLANVAIVQHAVLFAVIGVAAVALLGSRTRRLGWALLLLGTAIPAWDVAVPLLLPIAVLGASAGIAMLGIPAVIGPSTIEIPAGVFEIAEGCTGLRYVLSALALAVLTGELVGATTRWRWALIAIAVAVAVASNWLRILIVIAVGDATEMRHALVADHLWLGLVLFAGLVIPSLMFAAKHARRAASEPALRPGSQRFPALTAGSLAMLAAVVLALPAAARVVEATRYWESSASIELPTGAAGWLGPTTAPCPWSPQFEGADAHACAMYESSVDGPVFVSAVAYLRQEPGRELIRGDETAPAGRWRPTETYVVGTPLGAVPSALAQTLAPAGGTRWQMWFWYQLGSTTTPFTLRMKLAEALALPPAPPAVLVALATPCRRDCSDADPVLARYLASHPALAGFVNRQPPERLESR
jgi:EpsI family protein